MKNEIFLRRSTTQREISDYKYNFIIGTTLVWGFFINYLIVRYIDPQLVREIDYRIFLAAYFILCFLGIYLFNTSTNPILSFFGYNLVVLPFGFYLNIIIAQYNTSLVIDAIIITGIVTVIMMFLGTLIPNIFNQLIIPVTITLISSLIFEFVLAIVFHKTFNIFAWIAAASFCVYIGFDWSRANKIPKTVDNAIDSAAAIYMDIINLFIRILQILGRRRK